MPAVRGLERRYRMLLRCYPRSWRRQYEADMVGVLLDQADAERRSKIGIGTTVDLVGHGLEARLDALLRWLPGPLRRRTASIALVAGAGTTLLLLVGEVIGARYRPPVAELVDYSPYFLTGPVLTIGVGLYLAFMTAALLVVLARPGVARLLLLASTAYAVWLLTIPQTRGSHVPPMPLLLMCVGLGLLASLTTLELGRAVRRRLIGAGAGFVGAVGLGVLATRPMLGWSVGTMTSSGNVALAALALALPLVSGGALLVWVVLMLMKRVRVRPDWAAASAIAASPLVLYCTVMSVLVNPVHAQSRALIPVLYVLVVVLVATVVHRRRQAAMSH